MIGVQLFAGLGSYLWAVLLSKQLLGDIKTLKISPKIPGCFWCPQQFSHFRSVLFFHPKNHFFCFPRNLLIFPQHFLPDSKKKHRTSCFLWAVWLVFDVFLQREIDRQPLLLWIDKTREEFSSLPGDGFQVNLSQFLISSCQPSYVFLEAVKARKSAMICDNGKFSFQHIIPEVLRYISSSI